MYMYMYMCMYMYSLSTCLYTQVRDNTFKLNLKDMYMYMYSLCTHDTHYTLHVCAQKFEIIPLSLT